MNIVKLFIFHASCGYSCSEINKELILLYLCRVYIRKLLQLIDRHVMKKMIRAASLLGCRHDLDGIQNN